MNNKDIKEFFANINKLTLSKKEKDRMINLFQVRGTNKRNKVMSFIEFKKHLKSNKGKIIKLVLGPKWNRLVFVDINIDV
tara:strand:+ start:1020 stop:1259 length:240 start_codon:yes stop_codon:yes gene_type:complete